MNKLDTKFQNGSISISPASYSDIELAHRLIVLVPDGDLDYAAATRRVWKLADDSGADILFISLYTDISRESSLRRQLVMMTAMIQDGNVEAEAKVEFGNNWVDIVKFNRQPGDMVVCFAEQRAGLLYRPLNQILRSNLNISIYILYDLYPQSPSLSPKLFLVTLWIGFMTIIGGSFLLQIRIITFSSDWGQSTLLIFSIIAELWLIWVWNNLFS